MKSYLIYTDVPLDDESVPQQLSALDRSASVKVVVPIRPLSEGEETFLETEDVPDGDDTAPEARFANWRLRRAVESVRRLGFADVEGDAVADSPVDAIGTAVENEAFDAVVVITDPAGVAGWVQMDLAHRVERHVDEPVIHVEVEPVH